MLAETTISRYFSYFRGAIAQHMLSILKKNKIGGINKTVEIDESKVGF